MSAVKNFVKTYGGVGLGVYGGVTAINMTGIYLGLRLGGDAVLLQPLEKLLGSESETVQKIKQQLGQVSQENDTAKSNSIHWVREGTYFGIAAAIDSLVLPLKLGVCLPLARAILKRRGK